MGNKATILADINFSPLYRGKPIPYGIVDIFLDGTVTRADSWKDSNKSVLNTNPVILNAEGKANIFLDDEVAYDIILKTKDGFTVSTVDGFESNVPLTTVVNLSINATTDSLEIVNSSGSNVTLQKATSSTAGLMSVGQLTDLNNTKSKASTNESDITALETKTNSGDWVDITLLDPFTGNLRIKKIRENSYFLNGSIFVSDHSTYAGKVGELPFSVGFEQRYNLASIEEEFGDYTVLHNAQLKLKTNKEIYMYSPKTDPEAFYSQDVNLYIIKE